MKWENYSVGELCLRVTDGSHFSPKEVIDGYPMASSKDMLENDFDYSSIKKISETDFNKLVKGDCKPLKDDILIIKDGNSYLKYIFAIKEEKDLVVLSSIAILRPNKGLVNPLFFQSLLRAPQTKEAMSNFVSGAAIPRIVLKDFKQMRVSIPPLPTQRRIASILSAYDDLIENNLKRIKLLEEKAFLRYKQIVREEQLEKHILSEFGDIITGKTPSTVIADNFGDDVPFIKTPDMHNQIFVEHTDQMLSELGAKSQEKKILPPLSLCVSCIGTAGVVGITSKPSQTNQQINSIVFYEPENVYFFYALMSQMKEQLDALGSNGSTFTNVNKNKFENMEVYVPNKKVLIEFAQEFEAPFNLILTLQKQNTKLREARDILLPRLMNGEIEV